VSDMLAGGVIGIGLGVAYIVEGVATRDVPPSAVATGGSRIKPRTVLGARSPC
jgi:hypothetical protein